MIKELLLQAQIDLLLVGIKNENILNKELAEDLHKPITIKFKIWKKQSPFINNICGADLADTQLVI